MDVGYHRLYSEFYKRSNYAMVFRSALDDVAAKVDFSQVRSCVAFGTGSGEREIEFARRLLPNLRSFAAVEPDPESAKELQTNFQNGELPGVETSVVQTSLQSWSGVDNHVDAVLLFNMLIYVNQEDRKALFENLMTRYLSHGGIVAIANTVTSVPSGYLILMERLGKPRIDYDELEKEMVSAGFRVVFKQDLIVRRASTNADDDDLRFIQLLTGRSESEVRTAIGDILSQPNMNVYVNKLAVFTK